MADKRIWELATTSTVRTAKFLAMDSNAQVAAHKYDMELLVDRISTETIGGVKTFSDYTFFTDDVTMSTGYTTGYRQPLNITTPVAGLSGVDILMSNFHGRRLKIRLYNASSGTGTLSGSAFFQEVAGALLFITSAAAPIYFATNNLYATPQMYLDGAGVLWLTSLPSDDTEDHLVAIDDATGMLSKRAANTIKPALGTVGQIPYMNAGGTDFIYTSSLKYDTGFLVTGQLKISSIAGGAYVLYSTLATGQVRGSANMQFDGTTLDVAEIALGAGTTVDTIETTLTNDNDHLPTSGAVFTAIGAIPPPISFGTSGQVPYMNGAGTDFLYSSNLVWTGGSFDITGNYDQTGVMEVTSTVTDVGTWNSGSVSGYGRIVVNQTGGGDTQIGFQNNASTKWSIGNESANDYFKISKGFGAFGTDDYFTIDTNGNVGIGDSTPNDRLTIFSTTTEGILIHRNASTSNIVTGYLRFESDTVGRYSEISGYRFADSNQQGMKFWTYDTGFHEAMTINFSGTIGINTAPAVSQILKIQGLPSQISTWVLHDYPPTAFVDFGTSVPNRAVYVTGLEAVGAVNNHTAITLTTRTTAAYIAFASLVVQGISASNNDSRFCVNLRHGTGTTDYRTPFKVDSIGTIWWQAKNTSDDITMYLRQGATTLVTQGWDDSLASYVIALGTAFTATGRWQFGESSSYYYGSSSANFYIDGPSSTTSIYMQSASTSDSRIFFRNDTTTRFIMGYDYSASLFQIHSSTSFSSTAPDFCISLSGDIGIGDAPSASYPMQFYKNHTSGTQYMINIIHDGNNATAAQGIRMQLGQDTVTASDTNHILSTDGNGTTVGALLVDSTSYRIFNAISSRKYKKNIRPMEVNACEMFRNPKAQPKTYNFIGRRQDDLPILEALGETEKDMTGFVIEDLAEVFPDAVKLIDRGDGVRDLPAYADTVLIKYLVKAIAELDARLQIVEP